MRYVSAIFSMAAFVVAASSTITAAPPGSSNRGTTVMKPPPYAFVLTLNVDLTGVTNFVGPNASVAAKPASGFGVECLFVSVEGQQQQQLGTILKIYNLTKYHETDSIPVKPEDRWKQNPQLVPAKWWCHLFNPVGGGFEGSFSGYDLGHSVITAKGIVNNSPPYEIPASLSVVPQARFLQTPLPKVTSH